jgi:hypothetical protein
MPKKIKVFTVILPVIIFLGLFLYSVKSRETMIWLYAKTSYYVLFALCIIWVTQLIRYLEKLDFSLKKFLPAYGTGRYSKSTAAFPVCDMLDPFGSGLPPSKRLYS